MPSSEGWSRVTGRAVTATTTVTATVRLTRLLALHSLLGLALRPRLELAQPARLRLRGPHLGLRLALELG